MPSAFATVWSGGVALPFMAQPMRKMWLSMIGGLNMEGTSTASCPGRSIKAWSISSSNFLSCFASIIFWVLPKYKRMMSERLWCKTINHKARAWQQQKTGSQGFQQA